MIRIYGKDEYEFTSLGLGSLDEATAAVVAEELNGSYELELEYPVSGKHYDKLQIRNIIFCKPNMYSDAEPFRIYSITKPIDGRVTVNAQHISYDASGVVILPKRDLETNEIVSFGVLSHDETLNKDGYLLDSVLDGINQAAVSQNRFTLHKGDDKNNVFKEEGFSIPKPMNLRSILGGTDGSLLDQYKGEYEFNKFDIYLKNKRGSDRGITIRYGKNLTDLEQEVDGSKIYTGVFPFYSKKYTESVTNTKPIFQPAYVIEGVTPLRADWLSIEFVDTSSLLGGIPINPVVETVNIIVDTVGSLATYYVPIIIKTESSEYYDKIYIFRKNKYESGNLIDAYISKNADGSVNIDENGNIVGLVDEFNQPIVPEFGVIYVIKDISTDFSGKKIVYDISANPDAPYQVYNRDGFYVEVFDARTVEETQPFTQYAIPLTNTIILPTYPIVWNSSTGEWEQDDQNGSIYVYPLKPDVSTSSVDKYVYLDLLLSEKTIEEGTDIIFDGTTGILYFNETLKNLETQNILPLDMTSDLDSIGGLQPTDMTQDTLFEKAEQYLKDNDLTQTKETITVSFIQLSNSPEYEQFKNLEIVQLGDEINVIYELLGVSSKRRVIYTEYDVLLNSYTEIDLGDKAGTITNSVLSTGDNISNLNNDSDYSNKKYVVDFIAENAEVINAQIQNAIIKTLEVSKINVTGLLEASAATIDKLVANLIIAENAEITKTLTAGSVRVKGNIAMDSGSIAIKRVFSADIQDAYITVPINAYITDSTLYGQDWISLSTIFTSIWVYTGYSSSEIIGDVNVDGSTSVQDGDAIGAKEFLQANYPASAQTVGDIGVVKVIGDIYVIFECQTTLVGGSPVDPTVNPRITYYILTAGLYKDKKFKWNTDTSQYEEVTDSMSVFKSDWLSFSATNGIPLTPGNHLTTIFIVKTPGYYEGKKYKWNTLQDSYGLVGDYVFSVDKDGNVIANDLTITGGAIRIGDNFNVSYEGILTARGVRVVDGSISIRDKFVVDESGDVESENLTVRKTIVSDEINTRKIDVDDLVANRVYLNDENVYLERITENDQQTISQTINATAMALGYQDGNTLYIGVGVNTNLALYYTRNFSVSVLYYDSYGHSYFEDFTVTVNAGETHGDANKFIPVSGMLQYNIGLNPIPFPRNYTESKTIGGTTDKVVLHIGASQFDIVTGIVDESTVIRFFAGDVEPDTSNLEDNSLWFDTSS